MNGGDLTRSSFRAYRHYSGIRMQQGRVQLDADWNEQLDVTAHRDRAEALDVIGAIGIPKLDGGFELTVAPDGSDLLIAGGRGWVAGQLCEVDQESTTASAVSGTSITVSSLVLDGTEIAPLDWVQVDGGTSSVLARVGSVDVASHALVLDTSIAGLTGDLTLRRRASYACQPDLPEPDHTVRASDAVPRVLDLPAGSYLAYLDAWERTITALDDPTISEPALGVDTATRSKVVWQLRLLDLAGVPAPVDCRSDLSAPLASLAAPTGRMAARAEPPSGSAELCRPTPAGGYVGLENQLYRVSVHDLDSGRPVIVWSRENASVVTAWLSTVASDLLEVAGIGKDAVLGFQPGDWVELYDDSCVLQRRAGTLVRLLNAKDDRLKLDLTTATGSTDITDFPLHPQIRRWDSPGAVAISGDEWLELENGVQVAFPAGGSFRRHDYWLVPARSVLADVDWPRDSGGDPLAQLPTGVRHEIGKLAIVTNDATGITVTDCRELFPSLTTLTASDVAVGNEVCGLPGAETVQDAIDALCRANDLRRHNRLLHGHGIVGGLAVHCGDPDQPSGGPPRRFVTVAPGSAIDIDGFDLDVPAPVVVDVLTELESLGQGVLDEHGDGEVSLVLRSDPDRGPVVATTKYVPPQDRSFLDGTLLADIYDDCLDKLLSWIRAQLSPSDPAADRTASYLLRTALTNLLSYLPNPKSGGTVFVAETEHKVLVRFYEGLKKRLRSHTFCAMFDNARPYPDYPQSLLGIQTIAGVGMHARVRVTPDGREAWTTGGGVNPVKAGTLVNRYRLTEQRLLARLDPIAGKEVKPGEDASDATAAVSDVAFSPDGKLVYVAVPTRDDNDTLLRVGEIGGDEVRWRPATTICGVKLVTLATTAADPDHVYAVGLRRTEARRKAFSLREFTGAGIWRIPSGEVPDGIGPLPATVGLNTVGHLTISPAGEAVFTCGSTGGKADRYTMLVTMNVPGEALVAQIQLEGSSQDDVTIIPATRIIRQESTVWTSVESGRNTRDLVAYGFRSGAQRARIPYEDAQGRLSLQALTDRIVIADSNTSAVRVLDTTNGSLVQELQIPVQVAPVSLAAAPSRATQVVVLNQVSNSLTVIDNTVIRGDRLDLAPLLAYRRATVEAFVDLAGGFAQYLKDCICDHLLVDRPPRTKQQDLDLAAVSIRGGSVYKVCNFSRRHYVKSFPTVGYWLSLVPVLPLLREAIGQFCCTVLPEVFQRYSTAGQANADNRVDTTQLLKLLAIAQAEDSTTRLRNLNLGSVPAFARGANEGDWGKSSGPAVVESFSVEESGPKPPAGEIVLRNLLDNPSIRRVITEQFSVEQRQALTDQEPAADSTSTTPVGPGAAGTGADEPSPVGTSAKELAALVTRVEALEAELAALKGR